MSTKPIALILGFGARLGSALATKLASNGYAIALASGIGAGISGAEAYHTFRADFSNPRSVSKVFDAAKIELGESPSMVFYNTTSRTPDPVQNFALSITMELMISNMNVYIMSANCVGKLAAEGWATFLLGFYQSVNLYRQVLQHQDHINAGNWHTRAP